MAKTNYQILIEMRDSILEIESAIISGVLTSDLNNTMQKRTVAVKMSANLGPTNSNNCKCCGKG